MGCLKKCTVFFVLFVFVIPLVSFADSGSSQDALSKWTGKHTRLVWVKDVGNGSDTFAHGNKLMLYGYDSEDGKGARPLFPLVGNFFKPIFTPDGSHIIVSNRHGRQMYLVDWDTGEVSPLGGGVAVAVWSDPKPSRFFRKSTTWVYCFVGLQPENKYGTAQPLYRFPIDEPEKKELIWNKTNLAWSNIQLSRDGKILGGLFPWPNGGILRTGTKQFERYGRGCWTSMSPDNSKLLWIFDGLHRNVQMYDVDRGGNWKVNINGAPGVGGFEVYHPRWSNHPNYFVLTGPYEKGDGGNKIGGGGEKVEVYVGRFDKNARFVEGWFQVTRDDQADFYPDMWVEDGIKENLDPLPVNTAKKTSVESWPMVADRLVFVWENMKAANQLSEQSPVGFYQCNIELRGAALHTRELKLSTRAGWGETGEAGEKMGVALAKSGQVSVEFTLISKPDQKGTVFVFTSGENKTLEIEQDGSALLVYSGTGGSTAVWPDALKKNTPQHLVLLMDGGNIKLFINGKRAGKKQFRIDLAGQRVDGFEIGDSSGGWHGVIDGIAVYNSALSAEVVAENSQRISTPEETAPLIAMGTLLDVTEIPAPESIGAYRRALVVNSYSVDDIVQGNYDQDRILVAEWAVLDREIVKEYADLSKTEKLVLDKFDDHPELEGERQMMDIFEPDLDMYYRLN